MAPVSTSTNYDAIWNGLIALIRSEMTPTGTLATLADVRKSAQFSTTELPGAAVQWMGYDAKPYGSKTRLITHHFRLAFANKSAPTATRVANLDDAMESLLPLIDDGAGNGIVPLLNSPANFGLGGLSMETRIISVKPSWEVHEGAGQLVWAYWFIDYDADVRTQTA